MRALWRTWLGRVVVGWAFTALLAVLTYAFWMPMAPYGVTSWGLLGIYVATPAILLFLSLGATIRRPREIWPTTVFLVAFCGGFVLAAQKLAVAGGYLGLMAHRRAYDTIVQDAKAARLDPERDGMKRYGIRYGTADSLQKTVVFPWDRQPYGGWIGAIYDEADCPPKPSTPSPPPPPPGSDPPPTIKNAGRLDQRFHLSDHYCLSVFTGM